jgi:hypothetical protein
MFPAGFELEIPAGDRLQTLSLERSAIGIGCFYFLLNKISHTSVDVKWFALLMSRRQLTSEANKLTNLTIKQPQRTRTDIFLGLSHRYRTPFAVGTLELEWSVNRPTANINHSDCLPPELELQNQLLLAVNHVHVLCHGNRPQFCRQHTERVAGEGGGERKMDKIEEGRLWNFDSSSGTVRMIR